MKTYLDCIPCFFKQALEAARVAGMDAAKQRKILNDVAEVLPDFSLDASPPEMGRIIHGIVKKYTCMEDPYLEIKDQCNRFALGIYEKLISKLDNSSDRLLAAVELAIAGNIIDYGVKNTLNVDYELERILKDRREMIKNGASRHFQYEDFKAAVGSAKTILYLADNAGEVVFDRVLIEEIRRIDPEKEIVYVVKGKPIINDALEKDALDCGIDKVSRVISSGSDAPGTLIPLCSEDFLEIYRQADMVISKGQGNFEGLSCAKRSIFFLFIAKCHVIAKDVECDVGDTILLNHRGG